MCTMQVVADDVAVVVLHLLAPPPPAHAGRPAGVPPAATTAAAANDPAYLSAARAAIAGPPPRAPSAVEDTSADALPAVRSVVSREPQLLRTSLGQPGKLPATAVQDPPAAQRSRPLTVVTERRAPDTVAPPTLTSAFAASAAVDFRTDSAYTHDLRRVLRPSSVVSRHCSPTGSRSLIEKSTKVSVANNDVCLVVEVDWFCLTCALRTMANRPQTPDRASTPSRRVIAMAGLPGTEAAQFEPSGVLLYATMGG